MVVSGCSDFSRIAEGADVGGLPRLIEPDPPLIPTVNIAPAVGWPKGGMPLASPTTQVTPFARGLDHPRWLLVLPNGDLLVAESNAPERPGGAGGLKSLAMKAVMKWAGAGTKSANRITLLRDIDDDGIADLRTPFLTGLNSPFGMALVGDKLYVANTDAVLEFDYQSGQTQVKAQPRVVARLPAGSINHHWTKGLIASADGAQLYASVGSNSNIAERGIEAEQRRAAILQIDIASGESRVFSDGLRNPVGMAWTAEGRLWTVVNERDELGSDLVPDYLTSVEENDFFGWPWYWYGDHRDTRVSAPPKDPGRSAKIPTFALGSHVAPLGLAASAPSALVDALKQQSGTPDTVTEGMFIGLHGSWNRRPLSGYKVVWVAFENGQPSGTPVDVLTGFVSDAQKAWGRPAGVAVDGQGRLLVADDVGNTVWQVRSQP